MTLGERIKARRLELGMTQEELATRCGYAGRAAISKLEKCEDATTTLERGKLIATALECTVDYIIGWSDLGAEYPDIEIGEIAAKYSKLTVPNRKIVSNLIDSLLDAQS